MSGNNIVI